MEPRNQAPDRPHLRVWGAFGVLLVSSLLAESLVTLHPHFEVESWFGFAAGFGLASCLVVIALAKAVALLLRRSDRYYADPGSSAQRDD